MNITLQFRDKYLKRENNKPENVLTHYNVLYMGTFVFYSNIYIYITNKQNSCT